MREHSTATVLLAGESRPRSWRRGKARAFDPFDAKAEALALLDAAGVAGREPPGAARRRPGLAPRPLGEPWTWPEDHRRAVRRAPSRAPEALDGPEGAVAADIYLDAIPASRDSGRARSAFAPPALQPVTRDFAFLVPADLAADTLVRAIRGSDKAAITGVRLFDRFEAPEGLSLAVEVTLQPADKSFTDADIGEVSKRIVAAARKLGARLRS